MILWLVLFVLVIVTSFVLAMQSMRDFEEFPKSSGMEYGIFLIRNTSGLTPELLNSVHSQVSAGGLTISLERLFKGSKTALVIFGPKKILMDFSTQLNLLELEDYTGVNKEYLRALEVGVTGDQSADRKIDNFFSSLPLLTETEQFWWQLTLKAEHMEKGKQMFQSQINAVVFSQDLNRQEQLLQLLKNLSNEFIVITPKPLTSSQIAKFYQKRNLDPKATNAVLTAQEVLNLSLLS